LSLHNFQIIFIFTIYFQRHKKHVELEQKNDKQDYPTEILQQFPNLRLSQQTGINYQFCSKQYDILC